MIWFFAFFVWMIYADDYSTKQYEKRIREERHETARQRQARIDENVRIIEEHKAEARKEKEEDLNEA